MMIIIIIIKIAILVFGLILVTEIIGWEDATLCVFMIYGVCENHVENTILVFNPTHATVLMAVGEKKNPIGVWVKVTVSIDQMYQFYGYHIKGTISI